MVRVTAMNVQKALLCLFVLAVMTLTLPQQSAAQSPTPTPPDVGVPETTVTDGDIAITTDINGVETTTKDTTTLAIGSPTVASTSMSNTSAANPAAATAAPSGSSFAFVPAPVQPVATTSLSCSLHGAKDPG